MCSPNTKWPYSPRDFAQLGVPVNPEIFTGLVEGPYRFLLPPTPLGNLNDGRK